MTVEEGNLIKQIKELAQFLPDKSKEELKVILAYWEEMKAEWERKKQEFWKNHDMDDFKKLLKYKRSNLDSLVNNYKYLGWMTKTEREKFVDEYLQDDILYSGEIGNDGVKESKSYHYLDWKDWLVEWDKYQVHLSFQLVRISGDLKWLQDVAQMKLKNGMVLDLSYNSFWDEWAEIVAKNMKLEEWVTLYLSDNNIWEKWAKFIAENMELKEWVVLYLNSNQIWSGWAEAVSKMNFKNGVDLNLASNWIWDKWAGFIAKNMELKDWMTLNLINNHIWDEGVIALSKMELKEWVQLVLDANEIWDEWVKAIMRNMELKNWTKLCLRHTKMSSSMWDELREWEKSYQRRWINCKVEFF